MESDQTVHITIHLSEDTKKFLATIAVAGNARLIDAGLAHYAEQNPSVEAVIAKIGLDLVKEIVRDVLR